MLSKVTFAITPAFSEEMTYAPTPFCDQPDSFSTGARYSGIVSS